MLTSCAARVCLRRPWDSGDGTKNSGELNDGALCLPRVKNDNFPAGRVRSRELDGKAALRFLTEGTAQ